MSNPVSLSFGSVVGDFIFFIDLEAFCQLDIDLKNLL